MVIISVVPHQVISSAAWGICRLLEDTPVSIRLISFMYIATKQLTMAGASNGFRYSHSYEAGIRAGASLLAFETFCHKI